MASASTLLVGLPDDLTVHEILPRIPWYVRPLCRAASKLWKLTIDAKSEDPEFQHLTRTFQLPLLAGSILIMTEKTENKPMSLLLKDNQITLRKLPPVTLFPGGMYFIFWRGRIYVWTLAYKSWSPERDRIFKLDVGAGTWKWQSFPACRISNWFDAVCHDGKIYAQWKARHSSYGIPRAVRLDVQVYDMETDSCTSLEQWPYSSVGVSWKGVNGSAKLAGFSETREMVRYEAGVWKPEASSVVLPSDSWAAAHFIRGECFSPSLKEGFNVVFLGKNYETNKECIEWFNSVCSKEWSVIEDAESCIANDLKLETMQVVDGRVFALCRHEKLKRYIMHGTIEVAGTTKVVWEVFQELETIELREWTVMIG